MNEHEREMAALDDIIVRLNDLHATFQMNGQDRFADKAAIAREELFWLYHELGL